MSRIRFIPAPAGNSVKASYSCFIDSVHPRACGEQPAATVMPTSSFGSSPRLRGTVVQVVIAQLMGRHGSSPRLRGTGNELVRRCFIHPVHPRACGEQGSARHRFCQAGRQCGRFIPAPAGNSSPTVHCAAGNTRRFSGSSPRLRGTDPHHQWAGAGTYGLHPVHPRACGEQSTPMSLMEDDLQATVIPTNIPPAGGGHYNSHQHALFPGGGAKLTSFSPSNSRGIRRLIPTVSKSKP